jgi:probable HAF family extracellular repeat protein
VTTFTFTTIDDPLGTGTEAFGINSSGQIVGYYLAGGAAHGFLYSGGIYTTLDDPDPLATATFAQGINNAGQIVGYYRDSNGNAHGFLDSNGTFTTLDDPDPLATSTFAQGIDDAGQIVGYYTEANGSRHGFRYSGGTYSTVDDSSGTSTEIFGINGAGQIVGTYQFTKIEVLGHGLIVQYTWTNGFYQNGSNYPSLDDPASDGSPPQGFFDSGTFAQGINNSDKIIGYTCDSSGAVHGFLYSSGVFTTVDDPLGVGGSPGFNGTFGEGINDTGQIVGYFLGASGNIHAFLADPRPPVLSSVAVTASFSPQGPATTLSPALTITDMFSATLASATVSITAGALAGDVLTANTTGTAIAASYDSSTESLNLTGMDTLADYQAVLRTVAFTTANQNPTNSGFDPNRTVTWVVNDGSFSSGSVNTALGIAIVVPPPPAGTKADMILHNSDGIYAIYDIGNNAILQADGLGQVGSAYQFVGLGNFSSHGTTDLMLRNAITGASKATGEFVVYDIGNNKITGAFSLGAVGLEWQVAGFGDFNHDGTTDMVLYDNSVGDATAYEVYDISNNQIISANSLGGVGSNWRVAGFGDFNGDGTTDMLLRNSSTGHFEFYDIVNNQIASAAPLGTVGLDWKVAGFGDFNGDGTTDMMLRNVNTGVFELYDVNNNMVTSASTVGQVGNEWQVAGFGPIHGPGTSDMVLRNVNTGAFEVYDIANNQITGAAALGSVGLDWQLGGFAADPPSGSMSADSTAQLVHAMAGFGDDRAGPESLTTVVAADASQQPFLMEPQHV